MCGVIGIYDSTDTDISRMTYYGLTSLQHRGQESAGMAIAYGKNVNYYKNMGLVQEIFSRDILGGLSGNIAIGHVRYSTTGDSQLANAQPLVVRFKGGHIALAHNGNLVNATDMRREQEERGSVFQSTIDSEVIANELARSFKGSPVDAIKETVVKLKGSYALVIIIDGELFGVRDPNGLRPLVLGETETGYVLASESTALDIVGARFIRDVKKGEIIKINESGYESIMFDDKTNMAMCSFEYVYFARPDSYIDGRNVFASREKAGEILAGEDDVKADIVAPVPDSGVPAAIGYARKSGIPYYSALIKNKYVGRTFIEPTQELREASLKLKLNVLTENVKGKRVILVDDSIVRGTTMKKLIDAIKAEGAIEVHVRVSSPPVKHSCYFGIDTPSKKNLIGANMEIEEIRKMIGADSLRYLSLDGLVKSIGHAKDNLCMACFDGKYPMEVPMHSSKYVFEKY